MGSLIGIAFLLTSTQVDLSQFGLQSVGDVGYVSIGVTRFDKGDQIRVYEVRKEAPQTISYAKPVGKDPSPQSSTFVVSHFNHGNRNALNGYFNVFNLAPARSRAYLTSNRSDDASLIFEYDRKALNNFSGFWIHLFDSLLPQEQRIYFDSSAYQYLTFSVRSEVPETAFTLKIADAALEAKENAQFVGNLNEFLPKGKLTTSWQNVKVPLSRLGQTLDKTALASIVFEANNLTGKLFLKDVAFLKKDAARIPEAPKRPVSRRNIGRAMWLWETARVQTREAEINNLVHFAKHEKLTDIFLQIPYEARNDESGWHITWDDKLTYPLVRALNAMGVKVHALDGDPSFGLQENHGRQLALLKRVVDFNNKNKPKASFAGIRYDNEIYLLANYSGKAKESLLSQFISLLEKSKALTTHAHIELGVDVPFWFDARNVFGEWEAPYNGTNVMSAILDIADNIGIMDYRTVAYGADGVIAHAEQKLVEANKRKKRVFVGIETVSLPNETIYEFWGNRNTTNNLVLTPLNDGLVKLDWVGREQIAQNQKILGLSRKIEIPSSKVTFHRLPPHEMRSVMRQVESELSLYPSFAGIILHSYESVVPYLGGQSLSQ